MYTDVNPIEAKKFSEKIDLLNKIDKYLRNKSPYVKQVSSSIFSEYQQIEIIRPDNQSYSDKRPLVRFNVSVVVEKNGRKETGSYGTGGRKILDEYVTELNWKKVCDIALKQALINLESIAAPAGEMKVVLGPGWPGILLHEAIGHGLEGEFDPAALFESTKSKTIMYYANEESSCLVEQDEEPPQLPQIPRPRQIAPASGAGPSFSGSLRSRHQAFRKTGNDERPTFNQN